MVFTGTLTPILHDASCVSCTFLGDVSVGKFSDGEISVEINENVRGKDVFLIQPTCAPTNDNLMELVVMADAFRRPRPLVSPLSSPTSAMPARIAVRAPPAWPSAPR